jgi:tryptophanase
MENMEAVKKICDSYGIPLFIDSARFAENAWFIKNREEAFRNKSIQEIVTQMFSYADGMTMSSKKDGLVNIGGFVAMRNEALFKKASTFNIMFEGFITYGGLAGRDLAAMAVGLKEVLDEAYLESRILQVEWLTRKLDDYGIPVQIPNGGHAVFINANRFLPEVRKEEFIAQTLAIEIYVESGVRTVELGTLLADRDPVTRENRYPEVEFLRLSIPRRVYSLSHLEYVATGIKRVFDRRNEIKTGYKIKHEAEIMRHFTVELEKIK